MGCNSSQNAESGNTKTVEPESEIANGETKQPPPETPRTQSKKENAAKWSSIASNYSSMTEDTFQSCAEMSFNELPSGVTIERILDLASGPGPTVREALKRFPKATVTATDFSDAMLKELRKRCGDSKSLETKLCSMEDLRQFKNDSFDLVAAQFGAEFLAKDQQQTFWAGVARVLAPGKGTCLISAWNEKTFLSVFTKAIKVQVNPALMKLLPTGPPPLKEPKEMETQMQSAGLEGRVEVLSVDFVASSADELWNKLTAFSPKIKGIVDQLTKDQTEAVRKSFATVTKPYQDFGTGEIVLPCTFNLAIASKPMA